jgi:hypothetical protein
MLNYNLFILYNYISAREAKSKTKNYELNLDDD